MTKVVHFLILNYLSLFREHKDKRLTVEGIESIVNSIKVIWIGIKEGKKSFLKENEWAQKINTLFSIKKDGGDDWTCGIPYKHAYLYTSAWHFVMSFDFRRGGFRQEKRGKRCFLKGTQGNSGGTREFSMGLRVKK
ncbi:hypothetical protein PSHT_11718 [Puccinia striiformis]|uniref:Uncharacterized protein n=1 Tax=Puccinia striiformis TaxID=27350 RepID=A0A2S4V1D0_9BASI|nr:hypothetical protein PSHT_11718 [Puccinia striiformis]